MINCECYLSRTVGVAGGPYADAGGNLGEVSKIWSGNIRATTSNMSVWSSRISAFILLVQYEYNAV